MNLLDAFNASKNEIKNDFIFIVDKILKSERLYQIGTLEKYFYVAFSRLRWNYICSSRGEKAPYFFDFAKRIRGYIGTVF